MAVFLKIFRLLNLFFTLSTYFLFIFLCECECHKYEQYICVNCVCTCLSVHVGEREEGERESMQIHVCMQNLVKNMRYLPITLFLMLLRQSL